MVSRLLPHPLLSLTLVLVWLGLVHTVTLRNLILGALLGAGLVQALSRQVAELSCEGVAGSAMREAGVEAVEDADALAVMGLVEPLVHLPRLIRLRRELARRWLASPPDVFVGIDAPEFLLPLEARLKRAGVPVVHYVSPQVWAWRGWRIRAIARSVDLMLTLFPFETAFYERHGVQACCVRHPLADRIAGTAGTAGARRALGLAPEAPVLALLPGSRRMEIAQHGPLFLRAAALCRQRLPALQCVIAAASPGLAGELERQQAAAGLAPPARIEHAGATPVVTAADAVLTASGTATLETMLVRRPMVVAYRMRPLSHAVLKRLLRVRHIAMPNLLAGERLVPELVQGAARPEALAAALLPWLDGSRDPAPLLARFAELGALLRRDAGSRAAAAVLALAEAGSRA